MNFVKNIEKIRIKLFENSEKFRKFFERNFKEILWRSSKNLKKIYKNFERNFIVIKSNIFT